MQDKKSLTQAEVLAEQLLKIAPDVTRADRQAFTKEHKLGRTSLSNYLNGTVHDNDTAVTMLTFFRKRIANRYAAITNQ